MLKQNPIIIKFSLSGGNMKQIKKAKKKQKNLKKQGNVGLPVQSKIKAGEGYILVYEDASPNSPLAGAIWQS